MRALHLVKTSTGGTWAHWQMRELVRLGVEVHAAMPAGGPLASAYERDGVVVHPLQLDLPVRRPWLCRKRFGDLRALVAQLRPDILHSHHVGTTLTMRLALGKHCTTPRIFQVPGCLHLEHAFYRRAEILSAGPHDYWIGCCRWIYQRYLRSGVPPDRVFLSFYGVDVDRFVPQRPGKLRTELGLGSDAVVVGMVAFMYAPKWFLGQTRGLKGHEDLIDAVAICRRQVPKMVCVIVGGPWNGATAYEHRVRTYAKKRLGDSGVVFLGTRDDIPTIYADFDVVVHPSHSEGIGGSGESMLLGVPTVATNVGGIPEVIENGRTGWIVPPKSPAQLATAILDAVRDPARSRAMAESGAARWRAFWDVRRTAPEIVQIYRALVDRGRNSSPARTPTCKPDREEVNACR